jgi:hypothetical protein
MSWREDCGYANLVSAGKLTCQEARRAWRALADPVQVVQMRSSELSYFPRDPAVVQEVRGAG